MLMQKLTDPPTPVLLLKLAPRVEVQAGLVARFTKETTFFAATEIGTFTGPGGSGCGTKVPTALTVRVEELAPVCEVPASI